VPVTGKNKIAHTFAFALIGFAGWAAFELTGGSLGFLKVPDYKNYH
jgi:hypothetical protein